MGGPADKVAPSITFALREATMWRGMAHGSGDKLVDIGDIAVLSHTRRGIECHLFATDKRMLLPYPADDQWVMDKHNHVRIAGPNGKVTLTLAPTGD